MKVQKLIKRQIDFWGALFGLVVLMPLFLIIAVLIKLDSSGPVFFRQKRIGKNRRIFKIWKFRTLVKGAQNFGLGYEVAKNDPRMTKVGKFLRRFGIDEFPQFINVIVGEMSLVGPRTALPHQVKEYSEFEKRRFQLKPGIASLVHLKGWNALSWKERIKIDIWYLENWSLLLDLKILLKTFFVVLSGRGQYGKRGIVKDYE